MDSESYVNISLNSRCENNRFSYIMSFPFVLFQVLFTNKNAWAFITVESQSFMFNLYNKMFVIDNILIVCHFKYNTNCVKKI